MQECLHKYTQTHTHTHIGEREREEGSGFLRRRGINVSVNWLHGELWGDKKWFTLEEASLGTNKSKQQLVLMLTLPVGLQFHLHLWDPCDWRLVLMVSLQPKEKECPSHDVFYITGEREKFVILYTHSTIIAAWLIVAQVLFLTNNTRISIQIMWCW